MSDTPDIKTDEAEDLPPGPPEDADVFLDEAPEPAPIPAAPAQGTEAAPRGRVLGFFTESFWLTLALTLSAIGILVALVIRPPLPMDELRYLAVAWEMWRDQSFLVPFLNGETYSHKPPLLFWLMHLTWLADGIATLPARAVAPGFALLALLLTRWLGLKLWPKRREAASFGPLILAGGLFWALFSTLTMFDMLLAVFCLLGLGGVLRSWRKGGLGGFFLLAVAIGLGVLAKGPAILVSLLPAVLLAPIWGPRLTPGLRPMTWGAWYIATLGAVMLGAIIALLWAGPAAWMGGEAYRNAIFWGQSAGRMVDSFAHARPWWWYLALMPALLLPWTLWLPFWRGLWRGFSRLTEGGTLFCLVWLLPAFVAFSAISGKQLHYLLPAFPALALLVGRGLAEEPALPRFSDGGRHAWRYDSWPTGFLLLVLGAAVFALPLITETWIAGRFRLPPWSDLIDPRVGIALFVFGFVYLLFGPARVRIRLALMALVAPALVVGVHLGMRDVLGGYYDLGPVARLLGDAQAQGRAIAQFGKYHGQFNLEGRLTAPVTVIEADQDIAPWGEAHPDGLFVTYWEVSPQGLEGAPLPVLDQPFRSDHLLVWTGAQLARWPELGQRRRDLPPRPEPQVPDPENLPPASDEISPAPPLDSKAETP